MRLLEVFLLTSASLAMVFFTWNGCRTIFEIDGALPRWATQRGLRIIHSDARTLFQGPFFPSRYKVVFYVTVVDQQDRVKKGWISLGRWSPFGFREQIEERWQE